MTQRFNLVHEQWIPVVDRGRVSLLEIFSDSTLKSLGGNAVQKLSILKLLLAIAQSAYTPTDDLDWQSMGSRGLGEKCSEYLNAKEDLFWLYGDRPFLQMPQLGEMLTKKNTPIEASEIGQNYIPDLPSANDTILFQSQINRPLSDAEKAVFIVSIMNYSLGGKKIPKELPPLSRGYTGKTPSAKPGPSLGNYVGYLNSCLLGDSVLDTMWLNLFTEEQLLLFPNWAGKQIVPPWEQMPTGEDDTVARQLKESFMATLCSLSRFVLLKDDGIIYVEGIQYPSHKQGWREPFISYDNEGRMVWLNTSKKPWRNLNALLATSFSDSTNSFNCPQISLFLGRARGVKSAVGIWSGGLQVRYNAGGHAVKQTDDFIESEIFLKTDYLGEAWFKSLELEMLELESMSKYLWGAVNGYYKKLGGHQNPSVAKASEMFWELCERQFQYLVDICDDPVKVEELRRVFANYVLQAYNNHCPKESARQLIAWAQCRPNLMKYFKKELKEESVG